MLILTRCRPVHISRLYGGVRTFSTTSGTTQQLPRRLAPLPRLPISYDLELFRSTAFTPEHPVQFPPATFSDLPAVNKWFSKVARATGNDDEASGLLRGGHDERSECAGNADIRELNHGYFNQFGDTMLPTEMTTTSTAGANADIEFQRTEAPLRFLLSILQAQSEFPREDQPQIYIAQAPLPSLPQVLQSDLLTPSLVQHAGRGHIYDSSLWLGLAPTYTPLHKDPNPNLFVQLAGQKVIRIFRPEIGREVFETVARGMGSESALREGSEEMMKGEGRKSLETAVWGEGIWSGDGHILGYEASLGVGDAVFVPKGWWHSVRSVGDGIVGSVNWWFR